MIIKQIIPLNGHIYVEPVERKQLLVADTGRLENFGKVIAISEPKEFDINGQPICDVKVGDYVAFEMWDIKDLSTNDKKYFLIKAEEVICKLNMQEDELVA